jgi:hypothetical protein
MRSPKPLPSRERGLSWLLLVVALGASAWVVWRSKLHAHLPTTEQKLDLLSVVPPGPGLLVTADVGALSPEVALDLMRAGGGALLGLREQCGFEPLLGLRRVVFAMPFRAEPSGAAADFALIADTSLEPEPVLRCAEQVIQKRGGKPVRSRLGPFTSVRDQAKPIGEMAIRDDGLFVLSGGQYFRDVIDAASGSAGGDEASQLRTRVHLGVRRRLEPAQLAITLLPGANLPLPGVQALGLGLEVGSNVKLRGFVGCPTAPECAQAQQLLERLKADGAREPGLSGLASLSVVQQGPQLHVTGTLPRAQLGPLLTQLLSP